MHPDGAASARSVRRNSAPVIVDSSRVRRPISKITLRYRYTRIPFVSQTFRLLGSVPRARGLRVCVCVCCVCVWVQQGGGFVMPSDFFYSALVDLRRGENKLKKSMD